MTEPHPPRDDARRQVSDDLRRARSDRRPLDADLVPVEGGEPLPAEEQPAPPAHPTF